MNKRHIKKTEPMLETKGKSVSKNRRTEKRRRRRAMMRRQNAPAAAAD
jgi:hypothetical protein